MKLRDRDCTADYYGISPNSRQVFKIPDEHILPKKAVSRVPNRPSSTNQFGHFAADLYTENGERPENYIYVSILVNL